MRLILACLVLALAATAAEPFPDFKNTQKPADKPPTPQETLAAMSLPDGFFATVFAGDPDVHQPVDMKFDSKGRLWVVEAYSYDGRKFDVKRRDRILIFDDVDGDGAFDSRKVFTDTLTAVTSVNIGFGGVWAIAGQELVFIADADGDDKPDGPPRVLLDGFDSNRIGHTKANGLTWGPDGWLYARHGIQATSKVGKPGTPPEQRFAMNVGIWRYHPTRHVFEMVQYGTTNPWGTAFDRHGQLFFTNNVIGHLWHVVPGAHTKRMYGRDQNPYTYELGRGNGHPGRGTLALWRHDLPRQQLAGPIPRRDVHVQHPRAARQYGCPRVDPGWLQGEA
jgi:putative membrane-bound dehydrogenase-like protein